MVIWIIVSDTTLARSKRYIYNCPTVCGFILRTHYGVELGTDIISLI